MLAIDAPSEKLVGVERADAGRVAEDSSDVDIEACGLNSFAENCAGSPVCALVETEESDLICEAILAAASALNVSV